MQQFKHSTTEQLHLVLLSLPHGAICWSAVCDSSNSWSYVLSFVSTYKKVQISICNSEVNSKNSTGKAITLIYITYTQMAQQ